MEAIGKKYELRIRLNEGCQINKINGGDQIMWAIGGQQDWDSEGFQIWMCQIQR